MERWMVGGGAGRTGCSADAQEAVVASTPAQPSSTPVPTTPTEQDISVEGMVIGDDDYPTYTVVAPLGWSSVGLHFVIDQTASGVLGLASGSRRGSSKPLPLAWTHVRSGPSVDDLVTALVAQPLRNATRPTNAMLGRLASSNGPCRPDMVVAGDADFEGCDVQPSNGHLDFVSWLGDGQGERYRQVAGQVDMLCGHSSGTGSG